MRRRVFLTHLTQPSSVWTQDLDSLYEFSWLPLAKVQWNTQSPDFSRFECFIISSPAALLFLKERSTTDDLTNSKIFCVGKHTLSAVQKQLGLELSSCAFCSDGETMTSLLTQFQSFFSAPTLWLGSHQGLWKHRHSLERFSQVTSFLTHWNWPNLSLPSESLAALRQADYLVVSSLSAATSLSFYLNEMKPSCLFIFSSSRLLPALSSSYHDRCLVGRWPMILQKPWRSYSFSEK